MTSSAAVLRTELDGVAVLVLEAPGPLRASLVFRAGTATATFRTHPVPHLLEHLVLSSLPRVRHEVNGTTTAEHLSFEVSGTPAQVRETLHGICAAIRALPLDRLAHEARVVDVETEGGGSSVAGLHSQIRCGLAGAGLEGCLDVPAAEITAAQVRDFAARRLVRGNAVLLLTGPVPDALRLELPDGPRTVLDSPVRTDVPLPALVRAEAPLTALSVCTDLSPAAVTMLRVLRERAEEHLRHDLGLVYSVGSEALLLGPERMMRMVVADGGDEAARHVASRLLAELRALAADGPTPEELAAGREDLAMSLADPRALDDLLRHQAERVLADLRHLTGEEMLAEVGSVTVEQVQDCARRALGTVLVTIPPESEVDAAALRIPDLSEDSWEEDEEVTGTVHTRRLLSLAPLDLRAVLGEAGLSLRAHGCRATFPEGRIAAIFRSGPRLNVVRRDTRSVAFRPRSVRGGAALEAALLERWGHLFVEDDEDRHPASDGVGGAGGAASDGGGGAGEAAPERETVPAGT